MEKTWQNVYYLAQNIKVSSFDIRYGETHVKQCHIVMYHGCTLGETLSGESILKVQTKLIVDLDFCIEKKQVIVSASSKTALILSNTALFRLRLFSLVF